MEIRICFIRNKKDIDVNLEKQLLDIGYQVASYTMADLKTNFKKNDIIVFFDEKIEAIEELLKLKNEIKFIFITTNFSNLTYEKIKKLNPIAFLNYEDFPLNLISILELNLKPRPLKNFLVKVGNNLKRIESSNIEYISVDGKYCLLKIGGKQFAVRHSLKDLEQLLNIDEFLRIHQSYIVNINKIVQLNPNDNFCLMDNDEKIPLGRKYKKNLIEYFHTL